MGVCVILMCGIQHSNKVAFPNEINRVSQSNICSVKLLASGVGVNVIDITSLRKASLLVWGSAGANPCGAPAQVWIPPYVRNV